MIELKPCPFCGCEMNLSESGELIAWHRLDPICFFLLLEQNEVDMTAKEIHAEFLKAWNRRSNDAADAIEELLARDVVPMDFHERCLQLEIKKRIELEKQIPRWISVEERLPDDGVRVLVSCDDGVVRLNTAHDRFFDGILGKGFHGAPRLVRITHWMSLPEPPKGVAL